MKNIWTLIFGILMILGGLYALFNPLSALIAVALYLGILFIAMGIGYVASYRTIQSGSILALGIIDILIGILLVFNLGATAASLPFVLGLWALLVGGIQIILAIQFKKMEIPTWSWRMGAGILGVVFGLLMFIYPILGALTITILIGASLITFGAFVVVEYTQNNRVKRLCNMENGSFGADFLTKKRYRSLTGRYFFKIIISKISGHYQCQKKMSKLNNLI